MNNKFYKIGEISKLIAVPSSTLRYWESEFRQLKPHKSASGQRFYSDKHIELLKKLKIMLYDQKFTIDGVKKRLKDNETNDTPVEINRDELKKELNEILLILK